MSMLGPLMAALPGAGGWLCLLSVGLAPLEVVVLSPDPDPDPEPLLPLSLAVVGAGERL